MNETICGLDFRRHDESPKGRKRKHRLTEIELTLRQLQGPTGLRVLGVRTSRKNTPYLLVRLPDDELVSACFFGWSRSYRVFHPFGQAHSERYDCVEPEAVTITICLLAARASMRARGGSPVTRPQPGGLLLSGAP